MLLPEALCSPPQHLHYGQGRLCAPLQQLCCCPPGGDRELRTLLCSCPSPQRQRALYSSQWFSCPTVLRQPSHLATLLALCLIAYLHEWQHGWCRTRDVARQGKPGWGSFNKYYKMWTQSNPGEKKSPKQGLITESALPIHLHRWNLILKNPITAAWYKQSEAAKRKEVFEKVPAKKASL